LDKNYIGLEIGLLILVTQHSTASKVYWIFRVLKIILVAPKSKIVAIT